MKSVNVNSSEGIEVYSVDYNISDTTKRDICNALTAFRKDPNILQCEIDGQPIWGDIKLFDSTIDDKDRKEIKRGSFDDLSSDIQRIIIKRSGAITFKAINKWQPEQILTFEIE